jgi:hypothetical protein
VPQFSLASVSLVWYPNANNGATVGDPTNLDLTLPAKVSSTDPMQTFHITGVAPPGAHYAGARVTTPPDDYAPVLLDAFVIMAEPTEVSLSIKKQGQDVVVWWPRNLKHQLEVTGALALSNSWHVTGKPPKGIGATNYVDCPLSEPVRFFRLAVPN